MLSVISFLDIDSSHHGTVNNILSFNLYLYERLSFYAIIELNVLPFQVERFLDSFTVFTESQSDFSVAVTDYVGNLDENLTALHSRFYFLRYFCNILYKWELIITMYFSHFQINRPFHVVITEPHRKKARNLRRRWPHRSPSFFCLSPIAETNWYVVRRLIS